MANCLGGMQLNTCLKVGMPDILHALSQQFIQQPQDNNENSRET
jgi:hypothetical protein